MKKINENMLVELWIADRINHDDAVKYLEQIQASESGYIDIELLTT